MATSKISFSLGANRFSGAEMREPRSKVCTTENQKVPEKSNL